MLNSVRTTSANWLWPAARARVLSASFGQPRKWTTAGGIWVESRLARLTLRDNLRAHRDLFATRRYRPLPDSNDPGRLIPTRAREAGTPASGASESRFIPTDHTAKHVKFSRMSGGESAHAPANEHLANALLERLGMPRPARYAVEVPEALRRRESALSNLRSPIGLGTDRMPWSDVGGAAIAAAADSAPDEEVLLQFFVLTWLQVHDHEQHNFMQDGSRVIAIDFATGPADAVWDGSASLGSERRDHGALRALVDRIPVATKQVIRQRVRALTAADLDGILDAMPSDWATDEAKQRVRDELLRTREEVIDDVLL
jgi:hypothetical protein